MEDLWRIGAKVHTGNIGSTFALESCAGCLKILCFGIARFTLDLGMDEVIHGVGDGSWYLHNGVAAQDRIGHR